MNWGLKCRYFFIILGIITVGLVAAWCVFRRRCEVASTNEAAAPSRPILSAATVFQERTAIPISEDIFQGEIYVEGEPILMQPIKAGLIVTPLTDALQGEIKVFIPGFIELIDGNLERRGNFDCAQTITHEVTLRVTQPGVYRIRFYIEATFDGNTLEERNYYVFLLSSANHGEVSLKPPEERHPVQQQPLLGGEQ